VSLRDLLARVVRTGEFVADGDLVAAAAATEAVEIDLVALLPKLEGGA
jgi:hypothetical protein